MTGPAGRTSFVEDVEFGPSDHSSALQLLSLAGNSRSPIQEQPQQQPHQQHPPLQHDNGAVPQPQQPQVSTPTIDLETTKRALETQIRHNSPITTSGRHRKKRFKLKAEAAMNAMNASEEDTVRETTSTSLTEAAMALSDFGAAAAAADTTNESLSVPEPSSSSPEPPNVDANRNGINGSKKESRNGSSPTEQAEGSPLEEKQSRKPMPLKTLGHRKAGSRRHASLPMNRRKKHETIQSEQDEHSEPTEKVKKKSRSKSVPSKSIPTAPAKKEYVDNPTDQDILLGMRKFNSHPGNEVYRETVRKFQPLSKTKERTEVARDIINHIYNVIGGRFLKVDGRNGWEVMPLVDVMTKVGKAIVELRKKAGPFRQEGLQNGDQCFGIAERRRDTDVDASAETKGHPGSESKRLYCGRHGAIVEFQEKETQASWNPQKHRAGRRNSGKQNCTSRTSLRRVHVQARSKRILCRRDRSHISQSSLSLGMDKRCDQRRTPSGSSSTAFAKLSKQRFVQMVVR